MTNDETLWLRLCGLAPAALLKEEELCPDSTRFEDDQRAKAGKVWLSMEWRAETKQVTCSLGMKEGDG